MSKHVKSWDCVDITSNYKTTYFFWPYLSCVEAQRPEILPGRRIDGPSILPNPEIAHTCICRCGARGYVIGPRAGSVRATARGGQGSLKLQGI